MENPHQEIYIFLHIYFIYIYTPTNRQVPIQPRMMSAILVTNDFVPCGVLIPLLEDSNSSLETLGWNLNDLPPVPASFLSTLAQVTSIYSATVHHNPRYLLICLHGYCVLILNLSKKGSYLHWTFWHCYKLITDNREYCLQKNTIPRAALKATFQSLITQH